ncbi:MAG: 50S ribosomal protein L14e [Nanoarchaeota archaeon]
MEIGRVCIKLAGRDAGNVAVVVDNVDDKFVLIDGNVRRRKCNVMHLEPLDEVLKIKKNAPHADVVSEFKKLKLDIWNTKPKKKAEKPVSKRMQYKKVAKEASVKKKENKTEKPVKETKKKELRNKNGKKAF